MVYNNKCKHYFVAFMKTLHGGSLARYTVQYVATLLLYYYYHYYNNYVGLVVLLLFRLTHKLDLKTDLGNRTHP